MTANDMVALIPVDSIIASASFPEGERPYARRILYHGSEGEVLVMGWGDNRFCAPHDHGEAQGIVVLLRGCGTEVAWLADRKGIRAEGVTRYRAPAVLGVDVGDVHSMTTQGNAVTLHLYTPSIDGMRVFDVPGRRTLLVAASCGAWVPCDDEILEIIPW